jgi:hypothetical protein
MNKQEKIQQAYSTAYESLSPYIDVNGWVRAANLHFYPEVSLPFKTDMIVMDGRDWYRPKSLNGINDNNGWTKINSRNDLPKQEGMYLFFTINNRMVELYHYADISIGGVTHWRPIIQLPNPLY